LILFGATIAVVLTVVGLGTVWFEPRMARDLLGESHTPWNFVTWLRTLIRVIKWAPDLLVFACVGMFLWTKRRTLELRSLALAVWIIAAGLGTSAKRGADLNYYMSFRAIEALAAGTLWHAAMRATTSRGKLEAVCMAAVTAIVLWPTVSKSLSLAEDAINTKSAASGPYGQLMSSTYREMIRMAKDPNVKLLTDSGLFDAAQRERAVFGDPWQFHLLAETGQINLEVIERRIESQYYDLIITTSDLMMPQYGPDEFGLPTILIEPIRRHYESLGLRAGLYFYARRGQRAAGLWSLPTAVGP
jgi:hypothetical protein